MNNRPRKVLKYRTPMEMIELKERIEELEFVKEFQQDVIADFENIMGEQLSKKYLPKTLVIASVSIAIIVDVQ